MTSQSERDTAVPIVVPDMGLVLGCRLGAALEAVAAAWPGGNVTQSASGCSTYSLTQQVGRCAARIMLRYRFVDDRLVAIEMKPALGAPGGVERHLLGRLAEEVTEAIATAPSLQDEGYVEYALGELRIAIDTLDAVIRFEEAL